MGAMIKVLKSKDISRKEIKKMYEGPSTTAVTVQMMRWLGYVARMTNKRLESKY